MTATDRQLLQAHVDGDPEAFGELFARHRDRLWAVALRTTGDREEAADALQDAMVSAFRRAAGYRGDAAVTTWLHRVVVNACLDRLRAGRVRAADALPDDLEERTDRGSLRTAETGTPEQEALASERRRAVLAALATLPAEQRAALVLVDMEGYGVAEAAEILDCAVGTVKSRCARGRARLAPLLGVLRAPADGPAAAGNRTPGSSVPSPEPARGPPAKRPTASTVPHADPEGGEPPSTSPN
jgi:RNA polymerase sigma-70 factor (ECF subfamily)